MDRSIGIICNLLPVANGRGREVKCHELMRF